MAMSLSLGNVHVGLFTGVPTIFSNIRIRSANMVFAGSIGKGK